MLPGTRIFSGISNIPATDLDRLTGLKALSWLSPAELALLARTAAVSHFKESQTIFRAKRAAIRRSYPVARDRAYYLSERPRPAGNYRVDPGGSDPAVSSAAN